MTFITLMSKSDLLTTRMSLFQSFQLLRWHVSSLSVSVAILVTTIRAKIDNFKEALPIL